MSPQKPPRQITEVNAARGPHTPLPGAPTEPPPAPMPMRPPRQYEGPRQALARPPAESESIRDSREIPIETLLSEMAAKSEQARAAKADADALREELAEARGSERKALVRLAYKLGTPLVLLMGAATAWLGAHTAKVEEKVDRVEASRTLDKVATDPLPEKVQTNERDAVSCRVWAAAWDDYNRQVWGKLGVSIPQQPNALPYKAIETRAPRHKPNAVTGAPTLEVLTPPPALP